MKRQGLFLVCLLVILAVGVNAEGEKKKKKDSRIVNGKPIHISEAPYLVQLRLKYNGFFFCGGSLVTPDTVISAAHCLKDKHPNDIAVVAGATYKTDLGEQRRIIDYAIPKGYDFYDPSSDQDIVIFKLDSPMPFTENIQPIGLCDKPMTPDELAQISGWGAEYSGGSTSNVLQTIRVPIIGTETCQRLYGSFARVHGSMFCAANLDAYQDSCQGDSGGPLVVNRKLCGVVSWGRGCARPDSPGVYTSINAMGNFIHPYVI